MPRYACLLLVILSLSLSFPFALASEQASHSHARPRSIHFHSSRIHPPSHPQWYEENHQHIMSSATNGGQGGGEERQQYLVQLKWPYTQQERKNVEKALGVNLTTYIPYDTFLVHMLPSTLRSLYTPHTMTLSSELSSVVWIGHYHPSYKLHASVLQVKLDGFVYSNDTEPSFDLVAITAWPIPVAELRTLAQSWVDTMIRTIPEARGGVGLRVDVDTHVHIKLNYLGQMIPIATFLTQQMQIRYVQRYFKATIFNKWARGLTDSGNPSPDYNSKRGLLSWDYNLHGENQIIGVADSGLDWKSCYFYDPKFPNGPPMKKFDYAAARPRYSDPADLAHRKVIQYVQFADGLDQNGHGTHVSNSVGGRFLNADSSLSAWNGMAWAAQLAFYDLGLGPGSGLDIPDQLDQDLFPWAYQAGARIHSNSWGISGQNWYADKCYGLDHFAWQFPDMLIISAAGNEGTGQYSNTIGAPSTAKNALTVGASVQPEAAWQGSFCSGGAIPDDKFCRIQAYYKSTYNQDGLAVFSSLGPSGDGRIKPELVAPGMMIVSARADQLAGGASCNQPPEAVLKWQAGTSMAAPVVAGQAAILRQYFTEGYWPTGYQTATDRFNPSAALLKAVLISSTVPLNGVVDTEGYMFTRGVAGPKTRSLKSIPSMQQGYGRMQLSNSMFFPGTEAKLVIMMKDMKARPFEEYVLQNTGDYVTMTFCVVASSSRIPPPRVTLVWTDPPGNPTSGGATPNFDDDPNFPSSVPLDPSVLVNDLDLTVTLVGSNLFKYYPNGRLSPDRLNNVERIELPNTAGFTYLVNVSAYHIGIGPQPFSLVVTGNVRHTTCSGRDPNEVFQWQSTAWSQCSKACDGGIQSRTVGCVSNFEGFVEDSYCMSTNTGTKPPSQQSCNTVSCSSLVWQWTLGSYSSCSVPCGGGARRRSVTCMSTTRFIDDTETKCIAHAKPTTLMECNTQPCNATSIDDSGYWWKLGACNCSAPCGVGSCTRTVSCMFSNIPSDDISCLLNGTSIKPSTTVPCNVQPCPGTTPAPLGEAETFTWHVDYWQACSVGCGGGTQLRTVRCLSSRGYFDDDALCSSQPKPATSSSCNNDACPQQDDHNWQWIVGTWGPCSKYHQYRERWVICANTNGGYTDGTVCEAQVGPKPSAQQQCTPDAQTEAELTAPVTYQWWAGRWGDPHRLCGGGIQTRLVWCLGTHGLVASDNSLCPSTGKPDSLQSCCHQPCRSFATWYGSEWQGCSDVDPCKGTEHRETICVGSDGLRLADRSVCQLQTPPTNTRTPCGDCTSRSANSSPHSIMISSLPFMTLLMSAVLLLLMLR